MVSGTGKRLERIGLGMVAGGIVLPIGIGLMLASGTGKWVQGTIMAVFVLGALSFVAGLIVFVVGRLK
jgi:hypothetical protein